MLFRSVVEQSNEQRSGCGGGGGAKVNAGKYGNEHMKTTNLNNNMDILAIILLTMRVASHLLGP